MGKVFSACRNPQVGSEITLLLVGLDNAGKTTTAKHLCGDSLEDVVPTVGFSVVHLRHKKFRVTIYDLGGGSKIRGIWRNYYASVYGIIFVVDATDASRLDECKAVMSEVIQDPRVAGKPLLVLVNKQDIEGALDESDICSTLNLESLANEYKCPTRVELSSAAVRQGNKLDQGVDQGFQWLLRHISKNFKDLHERVEKDIALQKEKEDKERAERLERVRRIQEERERAEMENKQDSEQADSTDGEKGCPPSNPFRPLSEIQAEIERKEAEALPEPLHENARVIQVSPKHDSSHSVLSLQDSEEVSVIKLDNSESLKDMETSSHSCSSDRTTLTSREKLPHISALPKRPSNGTLAPLKKKKKPKKLFRNKVAPNNDIPLKESASSSDLTDPPSEQDHASKETAVKTIANRRKSAPNGQVNWAFTDDIQSPSVSNEGDKSSPPQTEVVEVLER